MRAIYNTLPFQKIPARLVIEMAKTAMFWLNAFPVMGGASQDLSPRTILTGQQVDYKHHCHFQFGEYTQTHEEHNNSMNLRTVGALALCPVGNGQGSFYFLSIATGRVLNRLHAMALPMPDDVIDKLHKMARQQKNNPGLVYADRNLNLDEHDDDDDDDDRTYYDNDSDKDEDEEELSYDEEEDNDVDEDEAAVHGPPVLDNNDDDDDDMGGQADAPPPAEVEQPPDNPPGEITGVGVADQDEEHDEPIFPEIPGVDEEETEPETPGVGAVEENEAGENGEDQPTQVEATAELPLAPPDEENNSGGRYNLHSDRNRNYNHRYMGEDFVIDSEIGIVMTTEGTGEVLETPQMSLKAGLQTFGNDGLKAVEKEMHQLYDRGVMTPVHKKCLMPEQQKEALAYLMFLKRKHCGKIKGHGCADGQKQRAYIAKEESTAPMVSTEAVFLTAIIDALENRNVAVRGVPGAFMQADIDELVHMRFTGEMVNMLLQINNEMYKGYVVMEKGEQVMYMELLKALYGTLHTA